MLLDPESRAKHLADIRAAEAAKPVQRQPYTHAPYLAKHAPGPSPEQIAKEREEWLRRQDELEAQERQHREAERVRQAQSDRRQAAHKSLVDPMRFVETALRHKEVCCGGGIACVGGWTPEGDGPCAAVGTMPFDSKRGPDGYTTQARRLEEATATSHNPHPTSHMHHSESQAAWAHVLFTDLSTI